MTDRPRDYDLAVFDGRDCAGWVRKLGDTFVAYGSGGEFLGRFETQQSATRAIPGIRDPRATKSPPLPPSPASRSRGGIFKKEPRAGARGEGRQEVR
jgi:hypothetical protein